MPNYFFLQYLHIATAEWLTMGTDFGYGKLTMLQIGLKYGNYNIWLRFGKDCGYGLSVGL